MENSWNRFKKYYLELPELGFSIDVSRVAFADDFIGSMQPKIDAAIVSMDELEKGAIANPDE